MIVSPDDCSLALRGLQTLHVRLKAVESACGSPHGSRNSRMSKPFLSGIAKLPGSHDLEARFTGSSGLFSVVFRPPLSRHDLHACMDDLELFRMGYSWGGVSSLVITPDLTEAPNARVYGERLVRFYVGLEDAGDLISDLERRFAVSLSYSRQVTSRWAQTN